MNTKNGAKVFLYVVRHSVGKGWEEKQYLVLSERDPTQDELIALLKLEFEPETDAIEAQRYDLDAIPKLPPKSSGSV